MQRRRSSPRSPNDGRSLAGSADLHPDASARRRLLRRRAVHGRRCGVHVRRGLRPEGRQARSPSLLPSTASRSRCAPPTPTRVVITLPAPHGPGAAVAEQPADPAGAQAEDRARRREAARDVGAGDAAAELAGLGPFVVESYTAGQRIELVRNPRYWRAAAAATDVAAPRSDHAARHARPRAELLALEAGEIDLMNGEVRPEDLAAVRRLAQAGRASSPSSASRSMPTRSGSIWRRRGPRRRRPWLDVRFRRAAVARGRSPRVRRYRASSAPASRSTARSRRAIVSGTSRTCRPMRTTLRGLGLCSPRSA